ncbi:MAG: hypothetical protein A2Z16_02255 [Chloroflexi bacterium RBG_16_54_18]|nr:MAG: hypothetical protein A2Z16_02255 [Chloroflexi bacterium RBG_16_54_18]
MQQSPKKVQVWLVLMAGLLLATLSCNLVNLARFGSTEPSPIPVSSQSVDQLVTNIEDAMATASAGGTVTLVLTEEQLTSLAAMEMQNSGSTEIENLQIRLRDGLVKITGQVNESGLSLRAAIDVKINIDQNGKPYSQVVSAKVGPFPVPEDMLNQLTSQLDKYLLDQISTSGKQLDVEQISIEDGKMTVVGTLK